MTDSPSHPFSWSRLFRLAHKELKETTRDRRTIVTLLVMPLLVYPLLSMAMNRFLLSGGGIETAYRIGVRDDVSGSVIAALIQDPLSEPPDAVLKSSGGELANFEVFNTTQSSEGPGIAPLDALSIGDIDVVAQVEVGKHRQIKLYAQRGEPRSLNARRILVERLQWLRLHAVEAYVKKLAGDELAKELNEETRRIADASLVFHDAAEIQVIDHGEAKDASILASIVPLVLVLMTITGAVYPAIDLTAGERERGTMEALMASPVPRFQVLLSKYFAVVCVALLTAVANLVAMFSTLWLAGLLPLLTGGTSFPWLVMLQILALLVLFSGFFSAVLLSLTSFARSFKEAQAYLIPVMLISITPGILSLVPGMKLSGILSIAPLINIVLLARELLSGEVAPQAAAIAVISTMTYAGAALAVAATLFGSDAVTRTSNQSFASILSRPKKWSAVPSIQSAAMVVALLLPVYFVCSSGLISHLTHLKEALQGDQADLTNVQAAKLQIRGMVLSAIALVAVFGLIPLSATWFGRHRLQSSYRLYAPPALSLFGAFVMGCGVWALAHEAFVVAEMLGVGGLSEEAIEQTRKVLKAWTLVPPWVLLLTLAATPAIIEELCFRGFLLSAIGSALSPGRTILLTAFLFGLFHVLTGNALLIERFVPSFLLGLVLGAIAYRTGSVIPGMVLHFVHNGLLELVGHYHEKLEFLGTGFDDRTHLPMEWIVIATTIAIVGAGILWGSTISLNSPRRPINPSTSARVE